MLHYKELFKPFTKDGATLEGSITWLKKTTNAKQSIVDQAVAETLDKVADGEKFELPCPCGCGMGNIHTPINHYMLSKVYEIKTKSDKLIIDLIQSRQARLIEHQMKKLVNNDKQMYEAEYGTWSERNFPTFRKWLGL